MLDPFTFYTRMMSTAFNMAGTAHWTSETLSASGEVIATRSGIMGEAARSPLTGDYAELSRMVPEKVDAFSKAGAAMAGDLWAMQSAWLTGAQQMCGLAMKGRAPTMAELLALSARNAALALRTFERASAIGDKGLAPIHASATANARRLKRRKT
jgi:hypothetical protein